MADLRELAERIEARPETDRPPTVSWTYRATPDYVWWAIRLPAIAAIAIAVYVFAGFAGAVAGS